MFGIDSIMGLLEDQGLIGFVIGSLAIFCYYLLLRNSTLSKKVFEIEEQRIDDIKEFNAQAEIIRKEAIQQVEMHHRLLKEATENAFAKGLQQAFDYMKRSQVTLDSSEFESIERGG